MPLLRPHSFSFVISCFVLNIHLHMFYFPLPIFVCFLALFACSPLFHSFITPCVFKPVSPTLSFGLSIFILCLCVPAFLVCSLVLSSCRVIPALATCVMLVRVSVIISHFYPWINEWNGCSAVVSLNKDQLRSTVSWTSHVTNEGFLSKRHAFSSMHEVCSFAHISTALSRYMNKWLNYRLCSLSVLCLTNWPACSLCYGSRAVTELTCPPAKDNYKKLVNAWRKSLENLLSSLEIGWADRNLHGKYEASLKWSKKKSTFYILSLLYSNSNICYLLLCYTYFLVL